MTYAKRWLACLVATSTLVTTIVWGAVRNTESRSQTEQEISPRAVTVENPKACPQLTTVGGANGQINANGTASDGTGAGASEVRVKVYYPPPTTVPTTPEEPYTEATLSGTNWTASDVPGAGCSSSAPYPENGFVAWATYTSGSWETAYRVFCGDCAGRSAEETKLSNHIVTGLKHPPLPHEKIVSVKTHAKKFDVTIQASEATDDLEIYARVYPVIPGVLPTDPGHVKFKSDDPAWKKLHAAKRVGQSKNWRVDMPCDFLKGSKELTCGLAVWARHKKKSETWGSPWVVHFQTVALLLE